MSLGELLHSHVRNNFLLALGYAFVSNNLFHLERRNSQGRSGYTFWLILQKQFCHFLTPKGKSGTDMINPLIESSDFLFWHKKTFWVRFLKILWETDKLNFIFWNLGCVKTHTLNLNSWNVLCLFPTKFSKI